MNNDRETLREWIAEQLVVEEGQEEHLSTICLVLISAGGEKPIFEMKTGHPKWGNPNEMAELLWAQASRTAKGLPGFAQFQTEAIFGTQQGAKPTRFMPFGIAGMTMLGPAAGGTSFAGMSTEAPTHMGQMMQGMRHQEIILQGGFKMMSDAMKIVVEVLEKFRVENQDLRTNVRDLWVALKDALLAIQSSSVSNAMKTLQMEAVRKLITLAPGLVNMMTGKDVFPASAVDSSLIEAMSSNLTPEEQQATISLLNAKGEGGQAVAAVISNGLVQLKKRKTAEAETLRQATEGLPNRSYDEALNDAGGRAMRVLKGQPADLEPKQIAAKKIVEAAETVPSASTNGTNEANGTNGTNGHAASSDEATSLLQDIIASAGDNLNTMLHMMRAQGQGPLADRLAVYATKMNKP